MTQGIIIGAVVRHFANDVRRSVRRIAVENEIRQHAPNISIGRDVQFANSSALVFGENVVLADSSAVLSGPGRGGLSAGRVVLGDGVRVGRNVRISAPVGCAVTIGMGATFFQNVTVIGNVQIGADCIFSGNIFVGSGDHQIRKKPFWMIRDQDALEAATSDDRPVRIADDVWIGWGAVIRPGVSIGRGAVVGANAVVTKTVLPYAIVGGCPAKQIGQRLSFVPPERLTAEDDDCLPYFYSGFLLRQRDLEKSRNLGVVWATGECEIVLRGIAPGNLNVEGLLSKGEDPITLGLWQAGTQIGAKQVEAGSFRISFPITALRSRTDLDPQAEVVTIRCAPRASRAVWGLRTAYFSVLADR